MAVDASLGYMRQGKLDGSVLGARHDGVYSADQICVGAPSDSDLEYKPDIQC